MDERPASATTALEIMRGWEWRRCDPDGSPFHPGIDLSLAVNRLAMEGLTNPATDILTLLCRGDLLARGDFTWRKYQHGTYYSLQDTCEPLKSGRWQTLADLMAEETRNFLDYSWRFELNLEKLEIQECPIYEWEFTLNRFSWALCPPDTDIFDRTYFEEWFSAWNIEVWPDRFEEDAFEVSPEPAPALPSSNKGGAPRKWDWDGALLHLAALAHHGTNGLYREDGGDPNQSDIARHLQGWFIDTCKSSPEPSQLREYGKRFITELNALKLRDAKNLKAGG